MVGNAQRFKLEILMPTARGETEREAGDAAGQGIAASLRVKTAGNFKGTMF